MHKLKLQYLLKMMGILNFSMFFQILKLSRFIYNYNFKTSILYSQITQKYPKFCNIICIEKILKSFFKIHHG